MGRRRCVRIDSSALGKSFHELRETDLGRVSEALYIVRPNYLDKYDVHETADARDVGSDSVPVHCCFRCGSVGTKEFVQREDRTHTGSGERPPSSVYGRMMMYQSNWLTGGKIYAMLQIDTRMRRAKGQLRRDKNTEGTGYVKWMEDQFHAELVGNRHVQRMRAKEGGKQSEWFFADDVMTLIGCLAKVAHDDAGRPRGTLTVFKDGKDIKGEVLLKRMYTLRTERARSWEPQEERQFRGPSTRAHP